MALKKPAPTGPDTEETPKLDKVIEDAIRSKVFKQIGGVPAHFHRMNITPVGEKAFRVNVYVLQPNTDSIFNSPKILHSLFI